MAIKRKKPRTKKQIAATKKLVALNRKRARKPAKKKKKQRVVKVKVKVKVSAKSRATGAKPKARLKRRRKANTKKGYYPNPAKKSTEFIVSLRGVVMWNSGVEGYVGANAKGVAMYDEEGEAITFSNRKSATALKKMVEKEWGNEWKFKVTSLKK